MHNDISYKEIILRQNRKLCRFNKQYTVCAVHIRNLNLSDSFISSFSKVSDSLGIITSTKNSHTIIFVSKPFYYEKIFSPETIFMCQELMLKFDFI